MISEQYKKPQMIRVTLSFSCSAILTTVLKSEENSLPSDHESYQLSSLKSENYSMWIILEVKLSGSLSRLLFNPFLVKLLIITWPSEEKQKLINQTASNFIQWKKIFDYSSMTFPNCFKKRRKFLETSSDCNKFDRFLSQMLQEMHNIQIYLCRSKCI